MKLHKICIKIVCIQRVNFFSYSHSRSIHQTKPPPANGWIPTRTQSILCHLRSSGGLNVEPFPLGPLSAAAAGGDEIRFK